MTNPLSSDDPEVWNSLVSAIHPDSILVVIGYRMGPELRRHVCPEDVFQETLLKAWRGRNEFTWQGITSFRRWLLRIAEHCVEDQRDRSQAQKRAQSRTMTLARSGPGSGTSSSDGSALEPWTSTTPSRMADARERAEAMERSLEALPEDVREVVRLRLFEDLQIDEIAGRLGLGESAVRHRFRKGAELYRDRLRALLDPSSSDRK
jgi:RNA polymerase sigma-70 factor (ECF subfamily)